MKNWAVSVLLRENEASVVRVSHTLHTLSAETEAGAKGEAMKMKVGFGICDVIVMEIVPAKAPSLIDSILGQ